MNVTNVSYKKLNISTLTLSIPKKENKVYRSNVLLDGNSEFSIQTPEVNVQGNFITFPMVKRGQFFTLLEDLEEKIIQLIYNNSATFFNGKKFSEQRIRDSFKKTFDLDQTGIVTLKNTQIDPQVKVYDKFKDLVALPEFPFGSVVILKIDGIFFNKKDIKLNYLVTHIKLPMVKKKLLGCILGDSDSEPEIEQHTENVIDQVIDELDFVDPKIKNIVNQVIDEQEQIPDELEPILELDEKFENMDFFEE